MDPNAQLNIQQAASTESFSNFVEDSEPKNSETFHNIF